MWYPFFSEMEFRFLGFLSGCGILSKRLSRFRNTFSSIYGDNSFSLDLNRDAMLLDAGRARLLAQVTQVTRTSLGEAQHALLVEQPIQARVALPALTDEACQRHGEELAGVTAFLVDLCDVHLHSAMLFSWNQTVRG